MGERLSKAEIEARFDSEHVLLGDPETDENLHVLGGMVLWHGKDEDEMYRKAAESGGKASGVPLYGQDSRRHRTDLLMDQIAPATDSP